MFSVIYTGMCWRPLWIAMVKPTMSGTIIDLLDQVVIGRLSLLILAFSTLATR
jgi:hypothetical protein